MLIDDTFYVRDAFIPQMGQLAVREDVALYQSVDEPELLNALLGIDLYAAFIAGLAVTTPEQKWLDLRDGKTYTDLHSQKRIWGGLANSATKVSPVANYVFYWYSRSTASWGTGAGQVLPKVDNGQRTSFSNKLTWAWNRMVDMNVSLVSFLNANAAIYPEWTPIAESRYAVFTWPVWWGGWPLRHCLRGDLFQKINSFNL